LKFFSISAFIQGRYPLAIVAGLLLAAAFPNVGVAGFAWVAPGLMLAIALGKPSGQSFRLGYVAGLVHYLASLYWLLLIPVKGFPILGWFALSAFIALYPATWVWLAFKLSRFTIHVSRFTPGESQPGWLAAIRELSGWSWTRRTLWAFSCAAIWVALEMLVARFLGGFPWNLLGESQYQIVPLVQIASVTGIYGVAFLVVWTSVSLLCATAVILGQPNLRSSWMKEILLPMATVVAVFLFGFHRLAQAPQPVRTLKVTLVQPSIPQALIWDADNDTARFQELVRLSEQALTNETDLLIWPEAGIPGYLRYDRDIAQAVINLASSNHVWMIVGSDDVEVTATATNYFNASFLISPDGKLANRYQKRNLVIFGEYIPLVRWLPFIKWFTPITGGFTSGEKPVPFAMPEVNAKASVLICYEDVFAHLAREYVDSDTDFLVNITNDGWFGEGAAQWQQAAAGIFRAVENGLPIVRCSNNGLTCWADANGRLRQIFRDATGRIYGPGFMTAEIPLLAAGEQRPPTFYNRHGDWFGWACVGFAIVALILKRTGRQGTQAP
jgi:apolipoprotein N-acyltransferase